MPQQEFNSNDTFDSSLINPNTDELIIEGNSSLTNLTVPRQVQKLTLKNCPNLQSLDCGNATDVYLEDCDKLKSIDSQNVTHLYIEGCTGLESVDFPSVIRLDLKNCQGIESINIPPQIQDLTIGDCYYFNECVEDPDRESPHPFYEALKKAPGLVSIKTQFDLSPILGDIRGNENIKLMSFYGVESHDELSVFPCKLEQLDIEDNYSRIINGLPETLKELFILNSDRVFDIKDSYSLTINLPNSLEEINIISQDHHDISELILLGNKFPDNAQKIRIVNFSFRMPEKFPDSVKEITFGENTRITTLPPLPQSVTSLSLENCENLTTLPDFPMSLVHLNLSGCKSLQASPENINKLKELEARNVDNPNFRLIWPEHFSKSVDIHRSKELISSAYREYYKDNPELRDAEPSHNDEAKYPTLKLIHRFSSESLESRGGFEQIERDCVKIAEFTKDNPKMLKVFNEIATEHLVNCINQPVAGILKIANIVEIAKKENFEEKIKTAKGLLVYEAIKEWTKINIGNFTGAEVELFNVLVIEINKKLLEEGVITESLQGVPNNIHARVFTKGRINPQVIDKAYRYVLDNLQQERVVDLLCSPTYQEFWSMQVLDEAKINEIRKPYEDMKKSLDEKIINLEATDAEIQGLKDKEAETKEAIRTISKDATIIALKTSGSAKLPVGEAMVGQKRAREDGR